MVGAWITTKGLNDVRVHVLRGDPFVSIQVKRDGVAKAITDPVMRGDVILLRLPGSQYWVATDGCIRVSEVNLGYKVDLSFDDDFNFIYDALVPEIGYVGEWLDSETEVEWDTDGVIHETCSAAAEAANKNFDLRHM